MSNQHPQQWQPHQGQPHPWQQPGQQWQSGQPGSAWQAQPQPWQAHQASQWHAPYAPVAQQQAYGQWPAQQTSLPAQTPGPRRNDHRPLLLGLAGAVLLLGAVLAIVGLTSRGHVAGGPAYQNEQYSPPDPDLNPPPVVRPASRADATTLVNENRLYQQSVPVPVRCESPQIDLTTADDATLKAHMENVMGCSMRAWILPIEAAGYQMPRPSVTVYSAPITTKCGKMPTRNAFYCSGDQQVYYAKDFPSVLPPDLRTSRFTVEAVMAHEFGHAIQGRTGLLLSAHYLAQIAPDQAANLEMLRRKELQADCFSGMFLRSTSQALGMTTDDLERILLVFESAGDDKGGRTADGDHGKQASRRYWGQMGLASSQVQACNTFTAPAETVR